MLTPQIESRKLCPFYSKPHLQVSPRGPGCATAPGWVLDETLQPTGPDVPPHLHKLMYPYYLPAFGYMPLQASHLVLEPVGRVVAQPVRHRALHDHAAIGRVRVFEGDPRVLVEPLHVADNLKTESGEKVSLCSIIRFKVWSLLCPDDFSTAACAVTTKLEHLAVCIARHG